MPSDFEIPDGYGQPGEVAKPFTIAQPVAWSDLDMNGHVNHAVYLTYFENGRFHYFEHVGVSALHKSEKIGPILARAEVDYLAPLEFPDTVLVKTETREIRNSSFDQVSEIWSTRSSRPVARAKFTIVLVDYGAGGAGGASVRVPDSIRMAMRNIDADLVEAARPGRG